MSYLGDQIFQLRKKEGLSQEEFAYRVGVSRQIVSRWENGMAIPRSTKVKIICDEFKISPDYLLGNESTDNMKNESQLVAKERQKLILKGIAILLLIVTVFYVLYFFYKLYWINNLIGKIAEFDKWNNFYSKIETYENAKQVSKTEIWFKDNVYKIVSEEYGEFNDVIRVKKIINLNENTRTEEVNGNVEEFNDSFIQEAFDERKYLFEYFPWFYDLRKNKIRICFGSNFYTKRERNSFKFFYGKKVINFDKDSFIPIDYSNSETEKITFTSYKIEFNQVEASDLK